MFFSFIKGSDALSSATVEMTRRLISPYCTQNYDKINRRKNHHNITSAKLNKNRTLNINVLLNIIYIKLVCIVHDELLLNDNLKVLLLF